LGVGSSVLEVLLPRRLVGSLLAYQDASAKRAGVSASLVKELYIAEDIAEAAVTLLVVQKYNPRRGIALRKELPKLLELKAARCRSASATERTRMGVSPRSESLRVP
jgi:hypothetical protein